jgi:RNA polymerase sigma-70 factor (ECF subfamily)
MNQLTRRGRTRADAEDLIQEGIARVYEYRAKGAEVREPEAVLVRTVGRLSLNQRRDAHEDLYTRTPLEDLILVDPIPGPEEVLASQQRLERVMSALQSVPERTREIFLLHRVAGNSHAEIAEQLGISVSAIEKHVARAMAVLIAQRLNE